jgi:sec-independent protein translocase protein TatB
MKFLNVGALEFALILLLAFIVLGPKQAVKVAGDVGRWVKKLISSQFWRDLVATSKQIQDLPQKMMDEAEIQKTIEDLERSTNTINTSLTTNQTEIEDQDSDGEIDLQ